MKSTVEPNSEIQCYEYPKQMLLNQYNMVVLFSSCVSGTVVHAGTQNEFPIGRHSDAWEISRFEPFHGKVTLESE